MDRYFPSLAGNRGNAALIGGAIENGTLSHAYILAGQPGTGKHRFAREIAAALACERRGDPDSPLPCGACAHCRRILSDASPDVRTITTDGATVGVEAIRAVREDLYLSSTEEEYKVYVFDRADKMTLQAQNALLIVLEEPPTRALFLLLTDRADALLPTIRSRAQCIRMRPLTREEMDAALSSDRDASNLRRNDPGEYDACLTAAAGSLGRARELMAPKGRTNLDRERAAVTELIRAILSPAETERVAARAALPTKRQELSDILSVAAVAVRDLILLLHSEGARLLFYTDRRAALETAESAGEMRLIRTYDAVLRASDALGYNANIPLTLSVLFADTTR